MARFFQWLEAFLGGRRIETPHGQKRELEVLVDLPGIGVKVMQVDSYEWEKLYRRYSYGVLRRCRRLLGSEAEATDAKQEVFLALLENPASFRGQSSLGTYLYSIATFVCLKRIRKQAIRDSDWEHRAAESFTVRHRGDRIEESLDARFVLSAILNGADETTRAIFHYYYVDGFSQSEISQLVGMSRVSVNKRLKTLKKSAEGAPGKNRRTATGRRCRPRAAWGGIFEADCSVAWASS